MCRKWFFTLNDAKIAIKMRTEKQHLLRQKLWVSLTKAVHSSNRYEVKSTGNKNTLFFLNLIFMKGKESNKAVSEKEHVIQMYRKIVMDKGLDR